MWMVIKQCVQCIFLLMETEGNVAAVRLIFRQSFRQAGEGKRTRGCWRGVCVLELAFLVTGSMLRNMGLHTGTSHPWVPTLFGRYYLAIPNDLIKYINSLHKPCFTQKLQHWTFLSANQSYSLIIVSQRGKENPFLLLCLHSISQLSGGLLQPRLCDQAFWFPPASSLHDNS